MSRVHLQAALSRWARIPRILRCATAKCGAPPDFALRPSIRATGLYGTQATHQGKLIARHAEIGEKIDYPGKGKPGEQRGGGGPGRIGEGGAQLPEQIEDRDNEHQAGVLEQRYE